MQSLAASLPKNSLYKRYSVNERANTSGSPQRARLQTEWDAVRMDLLEFQKLSEAELEDEGLVPLPAHVERSLLEFLDVVNQEDTYPTRFGKLSIPTSFSRVSDGYALTWNVSLGVWISLSFEDDGRVWLRWCNKNNSLSSKKMTLNPHVTLADIKTLRREILKQNHVRL